METVKKSTSKYTLKWLFQQVRTTRGWVLLSIALGLGSGILLIAQAWLLANIVHGAFMDDLSHTVLWPFFAALLTAVILRASLGWGREVAGFHAGAGGHELGGQVVGVSTIQETVEAAGGNNTFGNFIKHNLYHNSLSLAQL